MVTKLKSITVCMLMFLLACVVFSQTSDRMRDIDFHRIAMYRKFSVSELTTDTTNPYEISYRFFLHQHGVYEVRLTIKVDSRIPASDAHNYFQYDESTSTSVIYTIREQTSSGPIVCIGEGTLPFRDDRVFKLLLYLGQSELFSLPPERDALEPQHRAYGWLGSDGTVYAERRDSRKMVMWFRNIFKEKDGTAERLADNLQQIIRIARINQGQSKGSGLDIRH